MPPRRTAPRLLALSCVISLSALVWPGYTFAGGRIEPYVLGLPFSFAWVIGWLVLSFFVVVLYHHVVDEDGGR
jgi:hypothetical protein